MIKSHKELLAKIAGATCLPLKYFLSTDSDEYEYRHFWGFNFQRLTRMNYGLVWDEYTEMIEQLGAEYKGWA